MAGVAEVFAPSPPLSPCALRLVDGIDADNGDDADEDEGEGAAVLCSALCSCASPSSSSSSSYADRSENPGVVTEREGVGVGRRVDDDESDDRSVRAEEAAVAEEDDREDAIDGAGLDGDEVAD